MTDSQETPRSDREELTEVIKGFLDQYHGRTAGAGKTRVQKLVFFGELYALHEYGHRLSDADFKPYYHGSFAEEISDILDEEDGIEAFQSQYSNSPQYRNTESPRLSVEKLDIIKAVFQATKGMRNSELEQASKGSWLYEETEFDTEMDFDEYADDVLVAPSKWRSLSLEDRNPVDEDADSIEEIVE